VRSCERRVLRVRTREWTWRKRRKRRREMPKNRSTYLLPVGRRGRSGEVEGTREVDDDEEETVWSD
jgi:hypothetical protein